MISVVSPTEAISKIKDGSTIAVGGFVGNCPEELTCAIEDFFLKNERPRSLTLVYAAGQGDGKDKGINHFAYEDLIKRVIGGHWALAPKMARLALDNKIEAYNFPQGVITHLYRDIASKNPGTITHVGLQTFVDPRYCGGKVNPMTTEDLVELIKLNGAEWLFYRSFPIDVGFIRGTSADADGNISMEKETGPLEMLAIAQAVKNSGGIVIAQVERIVENGTLDPWLVKIPGILVDYVVIAKEENHWQTYLQKYDPSLSGEMRIPPDLIPRMKLDERKIISRRALMEIEENDIVNLGIGLPEGVSIVANEQGVFDRMKLTVEAGVIGGIPAGGLNFGTAYNPECFIDQPAQFDFYDGGGLDIAFLGMAQADEYGNVNVSRFGDRFAGCGGFIDISQSTKKVVFCGTFTSGGLEVKAGNGKLQVISEGRHKKFLEAVEQVTFNGKYARSKGHRILYITERCVFELTDDGMLMTEIAPGIDIGKQVIDQMDFMPHVSKDLKIMDGPVFID